MTPQQEQRSGGGVFALAAVLVGATGFAASLTCLYRGMREVMVNNGGFCASGGPYQINPGQVCDSNVVLLLFGGVFAGLIFAGVLAFATYRFDSDISGLPLLLWAALFGALGWNFIELGLNPPARMNGAVGWIISGVVFWLMALGGLIPGLIMFFQSFRSAGRPQQERSLFSEPLVRADVNLPPSPPQSSGPAPEFIDPVTGERHGGDGA